MNEFAMRRHWGPSPKIDRVINYQPRNPEFTVIAGPCSVESIEQIWDVAEFVAKNGATHLRGGVFRAGTYPGSHFGWIDRRLIEEYGKAADAFYLRNIIEVLDYRDIDKVIGHASCFQVGCRQMQNYTLLKEVGASGLPVFLKRSQGATIDELLGAAEWVLSAGCKDLKIIERGSATQARHVRWDLSISMIPAVQAITNIPILVDAAHGTGRRDLVEPMTLAGVAAGANGLLAEVHPKPEESLSDADQAISPEAFKQLMTKVKNVREVLT